MTIALLIQNGHSYADVLDYTLAQFEAFGAITDKLVNRQLARLTVSNHMATHAAPKDVEKYLESLTNG